MTLHPEFFDLVSNVRSMRRLKSDPVPEALLMQVLNAGVQASSGQNTQPWEFVVVSDDADKAWFAQRYQDAIESRFAMSRQEIESSSSKFARQMKAVLYQECGRDQPLLDEHYLQPQETMRAEVNLLASIDESRCHHPHLYL